MKDKIKIIIENKPGTVRWAIIFFAFHIVIGAFVDFNTLPQAVQYTMEVNAHNVLSYNVILNIMAVEDLILTLIFFILYRLSRGSKAARIFFPCLFLFGIALIALPALKSLYLKISSVDKFFINLKGILCVLGIIFIYLKPSSLWFRDIKLMKKGKISDSLFLKKENKQKLIGLPILSLSMVLGLSVLYIAISFLFRNLIEKIFFEVLHYFLFLSLFSIVLSLIALVRRNVKLKLISALSVILAVVAMLAVPGFIVSNNPELIKEYYKLTANLASMNLPAESDATKSSIDDKQKTVLKNYIRNYLKRVNNPDYAETVWNGFDTVFFPGRIRDSGNMSDVLGRKYTINEVFAKFNRSYDPHGKLAVSQSLYFQYIDYYGWLHDFYYKPPSMFKDIRVYDESTVAVNGENFWDNLPGISECVKLENVDEGELKGLTGNLDFIQNPINHYKDLKLDSNIYEINNKKYFKITAIPKAVGQGEAIGAALYISIGRFELNYCLLKVRDEYQKPYFTVITYSDYKKFDGILLPALTVRAVLSEDMKFDYDPTKIKFSIFLNLELNKKIPDNFFNPPEKKEPEKVIKLHRIN